MVTAELGPGWGQSDVAVNYVELTLVIGDGETQQIMVIREKVSGRFLAQNGIPVSAEYIKQIIVFANKARS